jgi:acid phosphatase type 7
VLVGAGDIGDRERNEDELTADALERIPGTVFTLGDHAYPDASRERFEKCYGPTWGRPSIKDRTRPTPGDDDYDTPGAAPYFEYFGEAAGDPATGYYAYDAGA